MCNESIEKTDLALRVSSQEASLAPRVGLRWAALLDLAIRLMPEIGLVAKCKNASD